MEKVVSLKSGKRYDVRVTRPTIWGNPWSHKRGTQAVYIVRTAEWAVQNFRDWLEGKAFVDVLQDRRKIILDCLRTLKGKTLACWCEDGAPCHAKVLAELANEHKDLDSMESSQSETQ